MSNRELRLYPKSNTYEVSARKLLELDEGLLVHGYHIQASSTGGHRIGHAWVQVLGKGVWDAEFDSPSMKDPKTGYVPGKEYYFWTHNIPLATYTVVEAEAKLATGSWGPWDPYSFALVEVWPNFRGTQLALTDWMATLKT